MSEGTFQDDEEHQETVSNKYEEISEKVTTAFGSPSYKKLSKADAIKYMVMMEGKKMEVMGEMESTAVAEEMDEEEMNDYMEAKKTRAFDELYVNHNVEEAQLE